MVERYSTYFLTKVAQISSNEHDAQQADAYKSIPSVTIHTNTFRRGSPASDASKLLLKADKFSKRLIMQKDKGNADDLTQSDLSKLDLHEIIRKQFKSRNRNIKELILPLGLLQVWQVFVFLTHNLFGCSLSLFQSRGSGSSRTS
jgi:hypothetical protein